MDLHVILYFERCNTIYASPSNVSNTLVQENQNKANVLYRCRCNKSVLVTKCFWITATWMANGKNVNEINGKTLLNKLQNIKIM